MRIVLKGILFLCTPILLSTALVMHSGAEEKQPNKGEQLYKSCISCHSAKPKFAGKSVEELAEKHKHFRDGKFTKPVVIKMQKAFKGMSDQDLKDLAIYINKL